MQSESKDSGGSLRTRQLRVVLKRAEVAESELSEARKKIERLTKRNERLTKHLDLAGTLSAGPHDHEYADRLRSEWDKSERRAESSESERNRLRLRIEDAQLYLNRDKSTCSSPDCSVCKACDELLTILAPPAQGEGKGVSK